MKHAGLVVLLLAGCSGTPDVGSATAALKKVAPQLPPLKFAVFGDVRPPFFGLVFAYPSDIIGNIMSQAEAASAQFAVGTGDYMFAFTEWGANAQLDLLVDAESHFAAPIYHALGNHECNTTTSSNCPNGDETANVRVFSSRLLPSGVTTPYYRVNRETPYGKAKLLFVAANAWSTAQSDWLTAQLADPTAYTFVVRHEPAADDSAPGVTPSESMMAGAPLTLAFLGHRHEYLRQDSQHVISGNGGAPLDAGGHYGFLMVEQRDDGNIAVSEIDQASGNPIDSWAVSNAGADVP